MHICQVKLLDKLSCIECFVRLRNNYPFVEFVSALEKSDITWDTKVIAISAIHAIAQFSTTVYLSEHSSHAKAPLDSCEIDRKIVYTKYN